MSEARGWRERVRALTRRQREPAAPPPPAELQAILRRVHELAHLEVRDVMTPRVDVVYLETPVTPEAVAAAVRDTGHSCFPVVVGELDDVDGVLFVNDLFRSSATKRGLGATLPDATAIARKVRRPPVVLPETMDVLVALEELRTRRRTFAVVVDEHGGVAGVVSTRDLLEPLVGDLADEFDEDDEPTIARIREDRWLVEGQTHVDKVNEVIGIGIPDGEYVTIAGFLLDLVGAVPEEGREVDFGSFRLRVQSLERRRISEVVVQRVVAPAAEPEGASGADG